MAAPWDERLTLNEFERRWKQLRKHTITTHLDELENDPFDCSSMKIPPAFGLVEDAIQGYVDEWRELDERKVVNQGESMPKWYEKHIRLPDNFDYESRNPQAPEDDGKGERVLSLEDPSQTLSHAQELWKLFHRVPTVEELEARATKDPKLEHMRALLNEQMEQTSNADALALSRLRVCDRHQFPPIFLSDREGAVPTIRFELWRRMLKRGVSSE